jgi:hypothetical protein
MIDRLNHLALLSWRTNRGPNLSVAGD